MQAPGPLHLTTDQIILGLRKSSAKAAVNQEKAEAPEYLRYLARRKEHRESAAQDPNAFIEYVMGYRQSRMHREWQAALDAHKRTIIVAPRLHGKTEGVPISRSLFHLGRDSNNLIKILCQSDPKAVKRLQEIRTHVNGNDLLWGVFPSLHYSRLEEENKHQLRFARTLRSKDPSLDVAGITSSASGDRATHLMADDVVDRRNAITLPKVREQINEAWDDWVNLLHPWGWLWYICTLWHSQDLSHKLLKNPAYAVCWYEINLETLGSYVRLPDGTERYSDEPLWTPAEGGPWGKEELAARREELGPRAFARGFGNRPSQPDEQRVDPEWIRYWETPPSKDWPIVLCYDLASTTKKESNWTGIAMLAVHPALVAGLALPDMRGTIKVMDAWHTMLKFPQKVDLVKGLNKRLRKAGLTVDNNVIERAAGGIELAEELDRVPGLPVIGVTPKHSKEDRFDKMTPWLRKGVVEFNPKLDPMNPAVTDERGDVVGEITDFPLSTKDIADALVHGVRYCVVRFPGFQGTDHDDEGMPSDTTLRGDARVYSF